MRMLRVGPANHIESHEGLVEALLIVTVTKIESTLDWMNDSKDVVQQGA